MSDKEKQAEQPLHNDEQLVPDDLNPSSNEQHIESADAIKSRIDADINEVSEKAADKDWAAELKAVEDKYLRMYAEFENFRRRTAAERIELFKSANQDVLSALLPVLDDFERALKAMQQAKDVESVKEGIGLVNNKFQNILQQKGLKTMDCLEKDFDPEFHEAITKIPSENLKGKVVDVVENGYFLNDKVIRFAKVIVGE